MVKTVGKEGGEEERIHERSDLCMMMVGTLSTKLRKLDLFPGILGPPAAESPECLLKCSSSDLLRQNPSEPRNLFFKICFLSFFGDFEVL